MDIDDIPVLRHLGWLGKLLEIVIVLSGYITFPLLILEAYDRSQQTQFINERLFFRFRMWGWIFLFDGFVMVMQCFWHNFFNKFWLLPYDGEWIFLTYIFTDKRGNDLFVNELGWLAAAAGSCFAAAWWVGELLHSGEFIPRYYKRMH